MVSVGNDLHHAAGVQHAAVSAEKVFLLHVTLPQSLPGISTGITMVFIPSVSTFIISKMLGGGSELMIGDLIEMQFSSNSYNPNLGSAISFVLMIIILICMSVMNQFDSDKVEKEGRMVV